MRMYDIIEKKRDGYELTCEELGFFIEGYCRGVVPDYQAAALLMAIFIRGMNPRETADITQLMANSGDRIDLSQIKGIKVDKHSTGGVGDKTTLVVGPIVAACGIPVAKMSGRGLGHTGGTIDKLESIPGFRTSLNKNELIYNIQEIGIAISGQTGNLAPADKKLYALRDVTATINSIPLIASSIMSKKIASGADKIVLDIKTGSGAFIKTIDESIELARVMVDIGERVGKETLGIVTDMDVPLGNAIGNSIEVREAINTLKGCGPGDLESISLEIAARMLEMAYIGNYKYCMEKAVEALRSGKALIKFKEMVGMQGGDTRVIDNENVLENAKAVYEIVSDCNGFIESIKTDRLGSVSMILGAGRETKESSIDYAAGIILNKKTGMEIKKGEVLAKLYTNRSDKLSEAEAALKGSFTFSAHKPDERPLILAYIDSKGANKISY